MKTKMNRWMMLSFIVGSAFMFSSCTQDTLSPQKTTYGSLIQVASDGTTTVSTSNLLAAFTSTASLSDAEVAMLLKMKEEEKLAHDVYVTMYEKWPKPIFLNISNAEERHLQAIITLLKFYNQEDTLVAARGIFSTPELTQLYQTLVAKGDSSLANAYQVGLQIEEMEIQDLTVALATDPNTNIVITFENLLKASRNHLRVFYLQLSALDIVYIPQYITQEEYDTTVLSPMEQGSQFALQNQYQYNYQYRHENNGH